MAKEMIKDVKTVENTGPMADTVQKPAPGKEKNDMQETVYPVDEFVANARKLFGTRPECAAVALRAKTEYTLPEAEEIVKKFLKKEVR